MDSQILTLVQALIMALKDAKLPIKEASAALSAVAALLPTVDLPARRES